MCSSDLPTPIDYWVATTYPRERAYRTYVFKLERNRRRPLIEVYRELADRFPHGLADQELLPEEATGVVQQAVAERKERFAAEVK